MKNKIVAGVTTKDEDWIIEKTLKVLDSFCDEIIVYDDNSTDGTENICRSFNKVSWFVRHSHDELIREEAKQRLELINLIKNTDTDYALLLDADEIPTPSIVPFIENADESTSWKIRMINLWEDETKYRCDSFTTKFGTNVNWDPFLPTSWSKYPLIKFDKNYNYTYELNVQKGGCSVYHPAPSNLNGPISSTEDFYIIHYGPLSEFYLSGKKHEFYSRIEEKDGKGSFEERMIWHKEHANSDKLQTKPTNKNWFWNF
jgi:glycosyltransferase involved in cell wall biosynthesis